MAKGYAYSEKNLSQFCNPTFILQSITCIPLAKIRKGNNSKVWETTCEAEYWHTHARNSIPRYIANRTSCNVKYRTYNDILATLVLTAKAISNSNANRQENR